MSIGAEGSQMVSDFTGAKQLSADSKEVLRDGIVSMPGNGYYCPCCNKIMTGAVPLMQHIDSNKHRKQRSMLFPPAPSLFDLPDINQLKVTVLY
ncbi:hypothetical protein Pmani_001377 [Petrolisthes manimaculis]|uniref:C2H2-type domain-containing protein n=1 Tax=Petrolisthes manimaculis TaxID=1843537 RepID=A0AAE1QL10_9EUCA|nr:hypothetical protein Pmani_001377 [Petrolisthes manimaculis]